MAGYDTIIHLSLVSNVAEGLAVIVSRLSGANIGVKNLESGLAKLRPAAVAAVTAFAGFEGLKGLWNLAKGGEELLDQQNKLIRLGVDVNEVSRLTAKGFNEVAKAVPTSAVSGYIKALNEMRAVTGDMAEAEKLAPKNLMFEAMISNIMGIEGGGQRFGEFMKLARSGEMKGISTDPKKFDEFTDIAFRMIEAFAGKLTPTDFMTLARRGGTAFANADIKKAIPAIAVMAADLQGPTAGNALMSLYALLMGSSVMSKQQFKLASQAGLINPGTYTGPGFGKVQLPVGAMVGSLEYAQNLPGWAENIMRPHLMALARGQAKRAGHPEQVQAYYDADLAKLLPNRKAQQAAQIFSDPGFVNQRMKDIGMAENAFRLFESFQSFINEDPKGVEKAYNEQKKSMLEAIGAPVMQAAIPVMKNFTAMFSSIGAFANTHPTVIKNIAVALGGLSAAFAVFGSLALIGAMAGFVVGGVTSLAILGIAGAITGLAALNWGAVKEGFESAEAWVDWYGGMIGKGIGKILDHISEAVTAFGGALLKIGNKIWDFVTTLGGWMNKTSFGGGGDFSGGLINTSYVGAADSVSGGFGVGKHLGVGKHASRMKLLGHAGGYSSGNSFYDAIIRAEGTAAGGRDPYNTVLGYGKYGSPSKPLTSMTLEEAYAFGRTVLARHGSSSAIGAFQIVGRTMLAAMKGAGLGWGDKFTPENQRRMADWIFQHQGPGAWEGFKSHPGERSKALSEFNQRGKKHETHVHLHVDGKRMASVVQKHLVRGAQYATSVGRQDGRGVFMGPGAEVFA